jgi:hypothetical protein
MDVRAWLAIEPLDIFFPFLLFVVVIYLGRHSMDSYESTRLFALAYDKK